MGLFTRVRSATLAVYIVLAAMVTITVSVLFLQGAKYQVCRAIASATAVTCEVTLTTTAYPEAATVVVLAVATIGLGLLLWRSAVIDRWRDGPPTPPAGSVSTTTWITTFLISALVLIAVISYLVLTSYGLPRVDRVSTTGPLLVSAVLIAGTAYLAANWQTQGLYDRANRASWFRFGAVPPRPGVVATIRTLWQQLRALRLSSLRSMLTDLRVFVVNLVVQCAFLTVDWIQTYGWTTDGPVEDLLPTLVFLTVVLQAVFTVVVLGIMAVLPGTRTFARPLLRSAPSVIALGLFLVGGLIAVAFGLWLLGGLLGWLGVVVAAMTNLGVMDKGPQPWLAATFLVLSYLAGLSISVREFAENLDTSGAPIMPTGVLGWTVAVLSAALVVWQLVEIVRRSRRSPA